MKKVFLTMMMLLFAFTGVMRAQETLTVHDGTNTNGYVPVYGFYADAYLKCEMVYPAAELSDMAGGMISSLTFEASEASVSWGAASYQVFVAEVEEETISAFAGPDAATIVYEGSLSIIDNQMVVTFTAPYMYGGGNLLVGFYQTTTGSYVTSTWKGENVTGASVQGYSYSGLSSINASQRNFLPKTTFEYAAGGAATVTTDPATLDLGYRPNGAWMAPYTFDLINNGGAINVTGFSFNDNYFTANAELPAVVFSGNPLQVEVSTGDAEVGVVSTDMLVVFDGGRNFETFPITATAYDPGDGDVYEKAIEVPALEPQTPYESELPEILYKNYELPDGNINPDAVYELTFDQDVLLYAGANSTGASAFLYTEDFEEVGGPAEDNYYEYNGPQVNPGPTALWWSYDYTGANTWYGTSAGGGFYFGYKLSTEVIADNELAGLTITTIESASYTAVPYECYIIEGGTTPFDGELVSFGVNENTAAMYFFDIDLEEQVYISGDEDIWVILYSDSPYACYCGRTPVDPDNAKVWTCNPTSTSPMWSSNVALTPVIFTRMLELPSGREFNMNLAQMKVKEGNGVYSEVQAIDGNALGTSYAQNYIEKKGNRATQTLINEGFEGGSIPSGWTVEGNGSWYVGSGDYSSSTGSATGTYNALITHSTTGNETYFITPKMDLSNATSATLSCNYINRSWSGDTDGFGIYYRVNGGAWNELFSTTTAHSSWTASGDIALTGLAANYQIGFKYVDNYGYGVGLDDVVVTADITAGGGGGTTPTAWTCPFTCQIDGMYVPAGTYYLVFASDVPRDVVNIAIDEVPLPEPAYVIAPGDGEGGVTAPYLAEWVLGNYTTEMQVLCGTQYPPTTVLIDWTDYLVESVFLTELENNKNYFMQVNARNSAGTTMGEVIGFTTPIDPVENFEGAESELYPGDAAEFTWDPCTRTLVGYNLYYYNNATGETVKVNEEPITDTQYAVEDLEYNNVDMGGYDFYVKALFAAGESEPSGVFVVYMTGTATISGTVYDQDSVTVIPNAEIEFRGIDEYGNDQVITATADENGEYTCDVLVGQFTPYVVSAAYDPENPAAAELTVVYNEPQTVNLYTHEFYFPVGMITATEQVEENNVLVEWSWNPAEMIVDFETGDFTQAEFTLPAQYPWTVTTTNPYEGTYCMKSTCEGQASASSTIEATVEVPYDAKMGFWVRVSSESNYDKFHFYIDGVEQGQALSGQLAYQYKEYALSAGTHTYKWEYAKDSSVNSNDDCVYVDNITMYRQDVPAPPIQGATVYDFENGMQGWTSLDANNDGYGWVLGSEIGGVYLVSGASLAGTGHESSNDMVCSGSYSNATNSAITPDNYLVSPTQISAENGAQIIFWACAQDASYAAEHFGVAVSTTTATASAFTMVQDWTMTAKSTRTFEEATRGNRAQGSWYSYTVDLSAYAGQDIWVAIRHFNCNDQFILNVDDITLADGSAKPLVRNDRTFQGYNLYRRDIKDGEETADIELIATPAADAVEYIDAQWPNLDYGMWQWGISATYEGNAPEPGGREQFTYGFEGGLDGWTGIVVNSAGGEWIHSDDNLGGYDYSTHAHTGSGFAMCYSFVDYVGSFDTDAFLVSPQTYSIDASSNMTFWADNANDSYPENFSVWVSTAANPTSASDFTQIWSGGAKGTGSDGAAVRHSNDRYDNWRSHEISLSSYAGQNIWIAFRDVNYDMYEIWIDDVTITAGGSTPTPPPTPTPTPSGLAESEIIWSNVIEKDMYATVTVNVALNNNQDPTGVTVTFDGPETYNETVDATGTVVIENFRKGTYEMTVALEGYAGIDAEEVNITEDEQVFDVVLYEYILPVEGLYVSPTGWAMWEGGTSGGGTTPVGPVGPTTTWTDDFEDGNLTNWTLIDADGDGDSWNAATPAAYGIGNAHSGTYCASSWSWNNVSLDPDQYMISPLSEGATSINYFVATNTAYPDHYGIVASSTGTNASDFTVVFEETAGSKGGNGGPKTSMTLNGGTREMSAWIEKTVELPAGTKYVGFRHWNSYDMNYLFIDDVTITMGGAKGDRTALSYKVMLDGTYEDETPNAYFQHNVEGFEAGSEHTTEVAAVYATGMGDWVSYDWIYTPCSEYGGVTNYTAAAEGNTVNLSWTLSGTPGPGPGPVTPPTTETFDFDDGTMMGWTSIDADNDGYGWVTGSNIGGVYLVAGASLAGSGHNSSNGLVCSGSYSNVVGALTPNNFLVAPAKGAYQNVSFYACGQDASYVAEHFGVAVATVDNPTAADFTIVNEWTMTAKGSGVMSIGRNGESKDQGTWHEFTADLSAYAGQEVWVAIRHFNCTDMFILDVDDITLGAGTKGNRAMWDLVYQFEGTSGYQYGVASDGTNIYTSSWSASSSSMFYKYDMQGNFIEEFNISGCGQLRGMTYDGQYFYGVANAATIYCVDLANHALIGTTSTSYGAMRCITYDPERDGFWVVGNWSGNLTLLDRTGAVVQTASAPTSASDVAYYKDPDGAEHVYYIKNESANGEVYEYNITTGTMVTSPLFNLASNTSWTGSSGGCFVGTYDGKTCFFADGQQSPQLIAIYELDASGTGPTPPPTPVPGEVLGVYVFRDGELISADPVTTGTYTDSNVEAGEHEYCVRVVYSDYAMSCPQCETVVIGEVSCDPVTNLTATQTTHPTYGEGILLEWEGNANTYKIYQGDELLGSISGTQAFIYNIGDGEYTFGVVAVYTNPACESEMVTVTIIYDAIGENEIVNNLYPNPTSDKVTIEAQGMNHITVATTLGQVVYDADVDADMIELNLGQYNAGVYLVRVSTVNGVSVKRVTVVK